MFEKTLNYLRLPLLLLVDSLLDATPRPPGHHASKQPEEFAYSQFPGVFLDALHVRVEDAEPEVSIVLPEIVCQLL